MLAAAALSPIPAAAADPAGVLRDFPIRHMSIDTEPPAGAPHPEPVWWVSVDDGTATAGRASAKAIPRAGVVVRGPAYDDPTACDSAPDGQLCYRSWEAVGDEVRVWMTWNGTSCVLIGSTDPGTRTRLNCAGTSTTI